MKMTKRIVALLALCLLLTALVGCGKDKEPDYSALIDEPLDVALADCLDAATVNRVLGYNMELLGVYEDGTQMLFTNDLGEQVMVQMVNESREGFDDMLTDTESLEAQEDLGEVAYWHSGTAQLMTYADGYAISVCIMITDDMETLSHSRQLTEHVLENLNKG